MLTLALCLTAVSALADLGEGLYEAARQEYWKLAGDGPEARKVELWRDAASRFQRVVEEAPRSPRAPDALYMVGLCLERAFALSADRTDIDTAVASYERLAGSYGSSHLADDALLRAGRAAEARGSPEGARGYYGRLLREQPGGDMAPLARRRLEGLGRTVVVEGVRHWSGNAYTRVVVDLDGSAPYLPRSLPSDPAAGRPERVYVDLAGARMGRGCQADVAVGDGLVRKVRVGQYDPGTVRVVLDLDDDATYRIFPLMSPDRIVLDVFRSRTGADVVGALITRKEPDRRGDASIRIVIDPGHGGRDPGAVGVRGLLEKDITLALSLELARVLRERTPWQVRLTRSDDRTLSLEERTAIANAFGANLFISIHANASRSSRARGVETYYLDRASDRAARKLAARENASAEAEVSELEHILADVLLTTKTQGSRRLAERLQRTLVRRLSATYGPVRDLGVKRGPFYVLTGAAMPAVLVEASFITHPEESRRLADEAFRQEAARAMASAVEQFVAGG